MSRKKRSGGHYDVGYGKPPKHSQFKKGQSGNRQGRPRGAVNKVTEDSVLATVSREVNRLVPVNDGVKTVSLSLLIDVKLVILLFGLWRICELR